MAKNRPVPLKDEPIITMEELHEKINHLGNLLCEIKIMLSEKKDNNTETHDNATPVAMHTDSKTIIEVNRNIGKLLVHINSELLSLNGSLAVLEKRVSSMETTISDGYRRLEEKQPEIKSSEHKAEYEKPMRPKSVKGMLGYWFYRLPCFFLRQFITSTYFKRWFVIILLCIWVISICFTCIIAIDNARMHTIQKKYVLLREFTRTDKEWATKADYIEYLYIDEKEHHEEIDRLWKNRWERLHR